MPLRDRSPLRRRPRGDQGPSVRPNSAVRTVPLAAAIHKLAVKTGSGCSTTSARNQRGATSVAQPVLSYLSATFFWCQCCWARPGCRRRSRTPTCRPTSCSSPAVACAHGTAQRHSSPSGYERRRPIRGDSRDYRGRVGLTCRRRLPDGLGRSGLICSSTRGPGSGSGWLLGAMITLLVSSRKP